MNDREQPLSPRTHARIGGWLYLFVIVAGVFAEGFVRSNVAVAGNPTSTAANILASQTLMRLALAGELILFSCDIALAVIFYLLLRPTSEGLALLAMLLRLATAASSSAIALNHYQAMLLLSGTPALTVFTPEQLQASALISLKLHSVGYSLSLVFFGFCGFVLGRVIYLSDYFPKFFGFAMPVAGFSYLSGSFTLVLFPEVASRLFPWILIPAFLAELSLCLWLIIKGINVPMWRQRAQDWRYGTA